MKISIHLKEKKKIFFFFKEMEKLLYIKDAITSVQIAECLFLQ